MQRPFPLAYSRLAELLSSQIAASTYLPGDRLPSVRELALRHRYSMETVLRAFRLLEDRGLVEPRPRSGFFVRHKDIRSAPSTQSTVFHATNVELSALRHQTILFGTATDLPHYCRVNGASLREIVQRICPKHGLSRAIVLPISKLTVQ